MPCGKDNWVLEVAVVISILLAAVTVVVSLLV